MDDQTTPRARLVAALNEQADHLNAENRVEGCWYLRGMADAVEWGDLADEDCSPRYGSAAKEAGFYRNWYRSGWNATDRLAPAFSDLPHPTEQD